jgi:hypothetical protein
MQAFEFLDIVTKNTKYLFRLSGYARSGQHAISNWIMSHAPHTSLWINNIHKAAEEVDFQHYWYGPVNLNTLQLTGLGFEGNLNKTTLHFSESPLILVIRDILNQTASVAKHPDLKLDNDFFEGWERNARQALGQTNIATGPLIVANYNNWVSSPEYRAQLYTKIQDYVGFDYPFVDNTNFVANIGGGSSFDGMAHQYEAKKMKVLERYKDSSVQDAIKQIPKRLIELSSRLFEN